MKHGTIISESDRPIWQIPIAAFLFTAALGVFINIIYNAQLTDVSTRYIVNNLKTVILLIILGISFCSKKRIHIDIVNSRFRPTIEVGPIKIGKWNTIQDYEYVSVFHQALRDGSYIFEVNLWYDTNKHFKLYEEYDYKEAFLIAYDLSEELDIDLLDATVPNDYKWIDKEEWKDKINSV